MSQQRINNRFEITHFISIIWHTIVQMVIFFTKHISYTFIIPTSINTGYCKICLPFLFHASEAKSMVTTDYSLSHPGHPDLICLSLNCLHLSVLSNLTHPHNLSHWTLVWFTLITPIPVTVQGLPLVTINILVPSKDFLASRWRSCWNDCGSSIEA